MPSPIEDGLAREDEGGRDEKEQGEPTAAILRAQLIASFDDYHSHIPEQVALVDRLIAAERREERERCTSSAPPKGQEGLASETERPAASSPSVTHIKET
jgi:hypothetical protein